jgi:hypothetical protein
MPHGEVAKRLHEMRLANGTLRPMQEIVSAAHR